MIIGDSDTPNHSLPSIAAAASTGLFSLSANKDTVNDEVVRIGKRIDEYEKSRSEAGKIQLKGEWNELAYHVAMHPGDWDVPKVHDLMKRIAAAIDFKPPPTPSPTPNTNTFTFPPLPRFLSQALYDVTTPVALALSAPYLWNVSNDFYHSLIEVGGEAYLLSLKSSSQLRANLAKYGLTLNSTLGMVLTAWYLYMTQGVPSASRFMIYATKVAGPELWGFVFDTLEAFVGWFPGLEPILKSLRKLGGGYYDAATGELSGNDLIPEQQAETDRDLADMHKRMQQNPNESLEQRISWFNSTHSHHYLRFLYPGKY